MPQPSQYNEPKKYAHFFKNLQQEVVAQKFNFRKSVFSSDPVNSTSVKTEDLAAKILQPQTQGAVAETINLQEVLPLDAKTTLKKMDNGFTYYIRDNAYPSKQTASLRLVIRAGSTDEQEHEQGLAHFLEHLLFHETENLGKQEIKRFLESKGAVFGADQNAHTSFNETVYKFDIPLNDPELLDKTLHILREMATKALISDATVEEERAVILDEISEESAGKRYCEKRDAILFEGTPYSQRYPAGLKSIVKECTPEQIRAFYKRTYLPQNMALVCVGDFDQSRVEELIHKHFNDIPLSSEPPIKHEFFPVERNEPQFVCHVDPEAITPILQLHYPIAKETEDRKTTVRDLRQSMINSLYHVMFNKRLQEIITDNESPSFTYANGKMDEIVDNLFYYRLTLAANRDSVLEAYKQLLLELKRVHEHGFLPEEFESAKKSYRAQVEHKGMEKNQISNKEIAKNRVAHFIDGSPYLDIGKILDLKKDLLETVKLEHINQWSKILTLNQATVTSAFLPESIKETVNTETLRKIHNDAAEEIVTPYVNSFIDRPLLRHIPKRGNVIETTVFEKTGITKWTLENGMNVYIKPSQQKEDSILMYATSVGGELSVPFEKRAAADIAESFYARSGQAGLTPSQLKKILQGKTIGQRIIIRNYLTSLLTTSSKKDFETAFQLLYTAYADRSFRKEAFNVIKKNNLDLVKHQNNDPEVLFNRTNLEICTQNHPMFQPITAEEYEKVEYQDVVDFLNNQFHNPGNFDLVITGNVDLANTKDLVETYLAGLPGLGKKNDFTSFQYPKYEYPTGVVVKEIEAGIASHCKTHFSFPSPAEDTMESRQLGMWTAGLLSMHLCDRLRFVKAENYSVDCDYAATTLPGQEKTDPSSMELEISGLPENIHKLNEIVLKELEKLHNEGFTAEELSTFRTQARESNRKALDMDSVWMSLIAHHVRWGWDVNTIDEKYNQLLDRFDENVAHEQLKKLFPLDHYVQLTLLPKKAETVTLL